MLSQTVAFQNGFDKQEPSLKNTTKSYKISLMNNYHRSKHQDEEVNFIRESNGPTCETRGHSRTRPHLTNGHDGDKHYKSVVREKKDGLHRQTRRRNCSSVVDDSHLTRIGKYIIQRTLGKGNFAVVKLAIHHNTNSEVAIKIIDKTVLKPSCLTKLAREVETLKSLNHPNIVQLYEVIESPRHTCLVMEYARNGEVFEHLIRAGRLSEDAVRKLMRQLISAVEYCHQKNIVHRDLKAENLLLDANNNIKLADFGFANFFDDGCNLDTFCGSPPYAAPELLCGQKYHGPEVDVWALGVIVYMLICGRLPFEAHTLKELHSRVLRGKYRIPYYMSNDCENMLKKMLEVNPRKRITLRELMKDKWINAGYNDQVKPYVEPAMDYNDSFRKAIMTGLGYKASDVREAFERRRYNDITATYLLLGDAQTRRNVVKLMQKNGILQRSSSRQSDTPTPVNVPSEELGSDQTVVQVKSPIRISRMFRTEADERQTNVHTWTEPVKRRRPIPLMKQTSVDNPMDEIVETPLILTEQSELGRPSLNLSNAIAEESKEHTGGNGQDFYRSAQKSNIAERRAPLAELTEFTSEKATKWFAVAGDHDQGTGGRNGLLPRFNTNLLVHDGHKTDDSGSGVGAIDTKLSSEGDSYKANESLQMEAVPSQMNDSSSSTTKNPSTIILHDEKKAMPNQSSRPTSPWKLQTYHSPEASRPNLADAVDEPTSQRCTVSQPVKLTSHYKDSSPKTESGSTATEPHRALTSQYSSPATTKPVLSRWMHVLETPDSAVTAAFTPTTKAIYSNNVGTTTLVSSTPTTITDSWRVKPMEPSDPEALHEIVIRPKSFIEASKQQPGQPSQQSLHPSLEGTRSSEVKPSKERRILPQWRRRTTDGPITIGLPPVSPGNPPISSPFRQYIYTPYDQTSNCHNQYRNYNSSRLAGESQTVASTSRVRSPAANGNHSDGPIRCPSAYQWTRDNRMGYTVFQNKTWGADYAANMADVPKQYRSQQLSFVSLSPVQHAETYHRKETATPRQQASSVPSSPVMSYLNRTRHSPSKSPLKPNTQKSSNTSEERRHFPYPPYVNPTNRFQNDRNALSHVLHPLYPSPNRLRRKAARTPIPCSVALTTTLGGTRKRSETNNRTEDMTEATPTMFTGQSTSNEVRTTPNFIHSVVLTPVTSTPRSQIVERSHIAERSLLSIPRPQNYINGDSGETTPTPRRPMGDYDHQSPVFKLKTSKMEATGTIFSEELPRKLIYHSESPAIRYSLRTQKSSGLKSPGYEHQLNNNNYVWQTSISNRASPEVPPTRYPGEVLPRRQNWAFGIIINGRSADALMLTTLHILDSKEIDYIKLTPYRLLCNHPKQTDQVNAYSPTLSIVDQLDPLHPSHSPVTWEIEVVQLPRLQTYGVRFKYLNGEVSRYRGLEKAIISRFPKTV